MRKPGKMTTIFLFIATIALLSTQAINALSVAFPQSAPSLEARYALSRVMGEGNRAFHAHPRGNGMGLENERHQFTAFIAHDASLTLHKGGHAVRLRLVCPDARKSNRSMPVMHSSHKHNRISLDQGRLRQWFVNGPLGLQQGFILDKRPDGKNDGNLVLALHVEGDLHPRLTENNLGIAFQTEAGETILTYSGLMVTDTAQHRLPAHFAVQKNRINIVVDDRDAIYPIVVDPVFQQAKLTASDGAADDRFGGAVAVDGDIIVVGARSHDTGSKQSAVYVFKKQAADWRNITQIAKLTASDGESTDWFGYSVDLSGNTIVVGAISAHAGGSIRPGAVYVFVRPTSGWTDMTENAKLTSSDGADNDRFGGALDIVNDTIVVGADGANTNNNANQGKAYIFTRPQAGWRNMTENARLVATDGIANDLLGYSVSLHGDTVAAGAPGVSYSSGAVYVFTKPQTGWNGNIAHRAKLMASDGAYDDRLGSSITIQDNYIVAGAPGFSTGGTGNQGAAYIFVRSGTHWTDMEEATELRASDAATGDNFGLSVAIDGNTIIVGAPYHYYSGTASNGYPIYIPNLGAVYKFTRPAGGWPADMRAKALLRPGGGQIDDHCGSSVAISGRTVVAGAPEHDVNSNQDQGAAYVFRLKKKSPWPMFISAVTSRIGLISTLYDNANYPKCDLTSGNITTHRIYAILLDLFLNNNVMPHFTANAMGICYMYMPVLGDIGRIDCGSGFELQYDAKENNGSMKIRRKATIHFSPTGICSKHRGDCTVNVNGTGSETIWQWYKKNNVWTLVPGMPQNMPIDWTTSPLYFRNIDFLNNVSSNPKVEVTTPTGEVTWLLGVAPWGSRHESVCSGH